MLEFAASEVGEVISGRKHFKSAAKSVGKQTLKKQVGSGKQKKIIPTKTTKQSSWSRRDVFANIFRRSCETTIFGTNLLWQCLEILRESPNFWRCPVLAWTWNLFNYLAWWKLHWIWISNGSEPLRWFETVFLAMKLSFSKVLVTIHTRVGKRKKSSKVSLLFSLRREQTKKNKKKKLRRFM